MNKILILILMIVAVSCNSNSQNHDSQDSPDLHDLDKDTETIDESSDDLSDEADAESEAPDEVPDEKEQPDIDMHCPLPPDAGYPYVRGDGTIHFCRQCDTPDEYDPRCIKSVWKDLNKEAYDLYKAGKFPDNEYIGECYPWPCEWNVEPTPNEQVYLSAHSHCDIFLSPRTWAGQFRGYKKISNMENGKIVFWISNYRYSDVELTTIPGYGYAGQRTVMYDIETGKYTVFGQLHTPAYMNGIIIANPFVPGTGSAKNFPVIVSIVPYKESYRYDIIYGNTEKASLIDNAGSYITDKWTIIAVNHLDQGENTLVSGNRSLIYSRTGEWNWKTLAYGYPEGRVGELSISGDKAMFAHPDRNQSYICDLSKTPESIDDCRSIGREGETAGFPRFDRDNPDRIAYRSMGGGRPPNRFVIVDISKELWKIEKEIEIPSTEGSYLQHQLSVFKSDIMLYTESYLLDASGYQQDNKLCFYRIDKEKVYCSKPIEGQKDYGHGFATFEGKYLFWQPAFKTGYILRDMECYCEKEGVCPFE